MRSFCTHALAASASLLLMAGSVLGQGYGSPSLLPLPPELPSDGTVRAARANNYNANFADNDQSAVQPLPVPQPEPDTNAFAPPSPASDMNSGNGVPGGCANGNCATGNGYNDNASCGGEWMQRWCGAGCNCSWFGSVGGMVLTRDNPNAFWTSFESANNFNQIMNTNDANANWNGGWLVSFGKWFSGCGCDCDGGRTGLGVEYWSMSPMRGQSTVFASDPLGGDWVSSTIDMNGPLGPLAFPDGNEVDDYFDNSASQTIARRDQIQNVEINLLQQYWQVNSACQVTWLAGVRWFRFDEDLAYSAIAGASTPIGADNATMKFQATNDLVGFQLGARCDYYVTQRWSLFVTPKLGLYSNFISTTNQVYNGNGSYLYDLHQSTTGASFLGSVDVGTSWQFAQNWRAFVGYRALAATGIALSDNQIPHYLAAEDELRTINRNGSLILHGGFAGVDFCF